MSIKLDEIYRPIKKDLNRVGDIIEKELKQADGPARRLSESILNNPGKRLRPALALFSAYSALGKADVKGPKKRLLTLAAAIELIHTAALVHDDVVDHSMLRRHKPTINAEYGPDAAIAFGDYLYSKGVELLARLENPEIISCVTSAAMGMCEGELTQILNRGNFQLKRQVYMTIIKKKAALLMSSCCSGAIMLVGKKEVFLASFSSFGLNFGIAFQMIDDCLDLAGSRKDLGKPVGSDLKMGELTLPLLFLRESKTDAFVKTRNIAKIYMEKAKQDLRIVKNSMFKVNLMTLADFTLRN